MLIETQRPYPYDRLQVAWEGEKSKYIDCEQIMKLEAL